MQELDDAREAHAARTAVARQTRGQEQEDRAQALAARAGDVAAHLLDQRDGRVELAADLRLDGIQIVTDQPGDALLQDPLESGRRHAEAI